MRTSTVFIAFTIVVLIACGETDVRPNGSASVDTTATASRPYGSEPSRLVYVPVYSHIYHRSARRQMNLTATLSIRNADLHRSFTVRRVDYYDSEGALVRRYVESPITVGPLSSRAFVVEEEDTRGGVGANFIIEWLSEEPVATPVIQAVMITTASTQGISFVTDGYPIPSAPENRSENLE